MHKLSLQQSSENGFKEQPSKEKPTPIVESMKAEPGWPTFGQLVMDLSKLALEAMGSMFLYFVPSRFRSNGSKKGLTPMKVSLRMPEDEAPPPLVQRQTSPLQLQFLKPGKHMQLIQVISEVPSYSRSKTRKERTRHRQRHKTGEVVYGTCETDQKPVETKPVDYHNSKFDHYIYNMRSKYGSSDSFSF
ncbi:hypothetical protein REPUB_Repub05bG0079100 [Reevesia pubescens]